MKKLQSSNDPNAYALVDDDVYDVIQQIGFKFCITKKGYFQSTSTSIKLPGMKEKKQLGLHRFVWILKTGMEPTRTVDHQDRNKSNNQFSNLRLATSQEQNQHQGRQKNNKSGYTGVDHYHQVAKYNDKKYEYDYWRATIKNPDGKCKVKRFPYTKNGKQHAAMWYDDHARKYFDDFAGELNFPTPSDRQ